MKKICNRPLKVFRCKLLVYSMLALLSLGFTSCNTDNLREISVFADFLVAVPVVPFFLVTQDTLRPSDGLLNVPATGSLLGIDSLLAVLPMLSRSDINSVVASDVVLFQPEDQNYNFGDFRIARVFISSANHAELLLASLDTISPTNQDRLELRSAGRELKQFLLDPQEAQTLQIRMEFLLRRPLGRPIDIFVFADLKMQGEL